MQGKFDLTLLDADGIKDADFQRAKADGKLDDLLGKLQVAQQAHGISNRLFDNLAGYLLDHVFQGPQAANPYYQNPGVASALAHITLLSTDADTTSYTEQVDSFGTLHNTTDSVDVVAAGKRFIIDEVSPYVVHPDPAGREQLIFRSRWLYLPSEAISAAIKSIGLYYATDAILTGNISRSRIGRVRLKDNLGTPITLAKTASQSLLVEYSYSLLSQ